MPQRHTKITHSTERVMVQQFSMTRCSYNVAWKIWAIQPQSPTRITRPLLSLLHTQLSNTLESFLRIIQFPTKYGICEAIIEQFKLFLGLDGTLVTTMHKKTKGIYDVFVCICQVIWNLYRQQQWNLNPGGEILTCSVDCLYKLWLVCAI